MHMTYITSQLDNQNPNEDDNMTQDGMPLPNGHHAGDGHDHDSDGKPNVSEK